MKMVASQAQCNSMQLWSLCGIFILITVNIQDHLCQGKPNVQDIIVLVLSVSNINYISVYSTYCVCIELLKLVTYSFLGISCKAIPTQIIGRLTGDKVPFPSGDNCTRCNNTVYFHCYSPTTLSDSVQTNVDNRQSMVYRWRYSPSAVPVLFVVPTNLQLNSIKLYYERDNKTLLGFPNLTFYHVPNDFEIWNYINLSQLEQLTGVVQLGEHPYIPLMKSSDEVVYTTVSFTPDNTSTKKLLMVITFIEQGVDFSVSEIEFNVMSEDCPPPEGNVVNLGITITNVQFSRNVLQLMDYYLNKHYLYMDTSFT